MKRPSRHLARLRAVQALYQWDLTAQDPLQIESRFIGRNDMGAADGEYFHRLVHDVPLYQREIDDHLKAFLDRPVEAVDPVEKAILRVGAYELEYQRGIPFKVIIDEAVELAKIFGAEHGYRFVNGVLDRLAAQLRAGESGAPESE